jgi:thiol-disulfide isomerase/thioredoxin
MKLQLLACLLLCVSSTRLPAQKDKDIVVLTGTLRNFSNQVEIEDMSDLQYLLPGTTERIIIPDSNGNFSASFRLRSPNYFRVGRNILYLSPGDRLEAFIDKNNPALASFKGNSAPANLYLRNTPFPKAGSFVEAGRRVQKIARATIDTLLGVAGNKTKELASVTGISNEFRRLEAARIKADLLNSLRAANASYRPRISADSLAVYTREYAALVTPLLKEYSNGFIDPALMKLAVYRDILRLLMDQQEPASDQLRMSEWIAAGALVEEMKKTSDKKLLAAFRPKVAAYKTPEYKSALSKTLDNLLKFGKGDRAVDFTAIDMNGNKVRLSSLKGKVIYVDLWATWCGPCLAEMPKYEALREQYKSRTDIAFVSLSIDDGVELWKRHVLSRKAGGLQWQIDRNALTDYDIVSIPRSLLFDQNFKVVDLNAALPSSKEAKEVLNKLLGL